VVNKEFSIRDAARFGFQLTFRHLGLIFSAFLIYMVASYLFATVTDFIGQYLGHLYNPLMIRMPEIGFSSWKASSLTDFAMLMRPEQVAIACVVPFLISLVFSLIYLAFVGVLAMGLTQIFFDLYDEGESKFIRLFSCFSLVGSYLVSVFIILLFLFAALFCSALLGVFLSFVSKLLAVVVAVLFFFVTFFYFITRIAFVHCFIVDKKFGGLASVKQSFRLTRGLSWKIFGLFLLCVLMVMTIIGIPAASIMIVSVYRKIS